MIKVRSIFPIKFSKVLAATACIVTTVPLFAQSDTTAAETNTSSEATQEKVIITKNTTLEELEAIKKEMNAQNFGFDYADVVYNSKNEITGITIRYKDARNNSGNYSVSSKNPINTLIINTTGGGVSIESNGNSGNSVMMSQGNGEMAAEMEQRRKEMQQKMEAKRQQMVERKKEMQLERKTKRNDAVEAEKTAALYKYKNANPKPLILLFDKEISEEELHNIDPDFIKKINIISNEKAVATYGEKAKNGVIIVTLHKQ